MLFGTQKLDQGIDVITDVHACVAEFVSLIYTLGYRYEQDTFFHPDGRRVFFLGDAIDRGPEPDTILMLMHAMQADECLYVASPGNHDLRLIGVLQGIEPIRWGGLPKTLAQFVNSPYGHTVSKLAFELFDNKPLATLVPEINVAMFHAALEYEDMIGQSTPQLRQMISYGQTNGQKDELGRDMRTFSWVESWQGSGWKAIFGHNDIGPDAKYIGTQGDVLALDTSCVFGDAMSAVKLPEWEVVSIRPRVQHVKDFPVRVDRSLPAISAEARWIDHVDQTIIDVFRSGARRRYEARVLGPNKPG